MRTFEISEVIVTMLSSFELMLCYNIFFSYDIESRLEGVDRRKLKFTILNTLQAVVSVIIKSESERGGENKSNKK